MKCPSRQMNVRDIISIVLESFINNNQYDKAIETLYQFTSLNYRLPYNTFRNKIRSQYTPLFHLKDYQFIGDNYPTSHQKVKLHTKHHTYVYLFTLTQQYDWLNQKPIYDPLTQKCLNRYWRIDSIQYIPPQKKREYIEHFRDSLQEPSLNIDNEPLQVCSLNPKTGFYRDGYCNTGPNDTGTHTVCARVSQPFLDFSKSNGNDLSTPQSHFPGLKHGDYWCLCANRYQQAKDKGYSLKVKRNATHRKTTSILGNI